MNIRAKTVAVTLAFAVPAFLLGNIIWPPAGVEPTGIQVPLLIFLQVLESTLFGAGIAFAWFGWADMRRLPESERKRSMPAFVALVWLLVSWWPHDHMHAHNGENLWGLIGIEYAFHVTLIAAGFTLMLYFAQTIHRQITAPKE